MIKKAGLLLFLLLLATDANAYIGLCCGKCGGNMPMNIPGGGIPETHEFRFKIQPMLMHMSGLRSGTQDVDPASILGMPVMMGKPTGKFMAAPTSMDMTMLNLAAGYSFSDDFFAGIMGMYVDNRMDMQFNSMMRMTTGSAGYTMKSRGIADTMLMAKYRLYADDPLIPSKEFSLFAGLSMPTGSIDKRNTTHPVAMRQKELLPYGMQLGSGTWDPIIGALYQHSSSPWWWGLDVRYTARTGTNKRGYRLGDRGQVDGYLMYQPHYAWVLYGELNGEWQGRLHGEADEARTGASGRAIQGMASSPYMTPLWDPANMGKTQMFATLGVQWQPVPLQIVDVGVQVPLYQRLNGLQLKDSWRVMLTWYVEIPTSQSVRSLSHTPADAELGF
ncbi:MAG: transporter [Zetaproteobacteria bacterium]|nr:MAG: transporter [Zetaproteobacteria bacterium]